MSSLYAQLTPGDRLDFGGPARVIEIGEITAGIAVPEGRGVRFFSSARDFDGLDGAVFRTAEQAARAARERVRARSRSAEVPKQGHLRRA